VRLFLQDELRVARDARAELGRDGNHAPSPTAAAAAAAAASARGGGGGKGGGAASAEKDAAAASTDGAKLAAGPRASNESGARASA
jgi:hypothetical protein